MAITNYTELQSAIADWLARTDLTERIPDFIRLAETALQKVVRDPEMVTTSNITLSATDDFKALPTDLLDLIFIQTSANEPLEQVNIPQLTILRRHRLKTAGTPKFFAVIGRNAHFAPAPSGAVTLECYYYAKLAALSGGSPTNWLITSHPDIYLYASLLQAQPFLQNDARAAMMDNMMTKSIQQAVTAGNHVTIDALKRVGFSLGAPADANVAEPGSAIGAVAPNPA